MPFDVGTFLAGGVEGLLKGARDLISLWKLDPAIAAKNEQERAAWAAKMAEMEVELKRSELNFDLAMTQAQTKINEIEAASTDAFVRRARPAALWICNGGLAYAFLVRPFITWVSGWISTGSPGPAPDLNVEVLITLMFGLLGLSTLRTFDKMKGTSR